MITMEMGKLVAQAEGEIKLSAEIFNYYANHAKDFFGRQNFKICTWSGADKALPYWCLTASTALEFLFYQVARFAVPNIMAGNTILIKHASIVPQCSIAIEEIFKSAEATVGLYTNLLISGKRASALVSDKRIKGVSVTGSEAAGASIASEAGKYLKKSVLELGGSDAFIILEDADIEKAVEWAVVDRINNNGEYCVASIHFIAVERISADFLKNIQKQIS